MNDPCIVIEFISSIVALFTGIAAIIGLGIAKKQLGSIKDQILIAITNQKLDSLRIVLEIETQMNSRKLEFDKASKQVREGELENLDNQKMEILIDYFEATKESYFNSLDRLCYCIDRDYIPDKDWRTEYRNLLKDTIDNYTEDFDESSPYINIKKINRLWQTT